MLYWEINKYMLSVNMNSNSSWICLIIFTAVCRVYSYLGLPCPRSLLRIPSMWSIWLLLGHKIAFLAPGVEPVTDCQVVLRTGSVTSGSVAIQNVSCKREWPMFGHSTWQSLCCLDENRWTRRSRMLPATQNCVACGDICYEKTSLNPFRGNAKIERRNNFENLRALYLRIHCFGFRTPVGGKIFRTRPVRPWGTAGHMRNGYRVFSAVKAAEVTTTHPHLASRLKKE